MVRIKRASFAIALALIISMFAQIVSPALAEAPKYEKPLPVVSGSSSDPRTFTYNGHVVSQGFAVSTSMMAAVEPNEFSFSKAACAVSLSGTGWMEGSYSFEPWVTSIWVKVEGNSFYRVNVGGIVDNTGTGGSCTSSWDILLGVIETLLPYLFEYLAQQPPLKEWQSDLHWAKAIVRSEEPYEGGRIQPTANPSVETEGCDFSSLFSQAGNQYLTVTAGADIAVVRSWWARGDYLYWDVIPVNSYSVTFQVRVPVTNEPETPSIPSGPSSVSRGLSYTYSTTTVDPDGDNVRYQFDWGDGTTTTTGWYASGVAASASHSWSNPGIYQVQVRAQDVYEEWSCRSPILTVTVNILYVTLTLRVPQAPAQGYDTDGTPREPVSIWVDGTEYNFFANTIAYIPVAAGIPHSLTAQYAFDKEEWKPGYYYTYTFLYWNDGVTSRTRIINISSDAALAADYLRSKYAII